MESVIHSFKIGDFRCSVINDASGIMTAGDLIGNETTEEQLAKIAHDFELDLVQIPLPVDNLLVDTGDQKILIDTGSGIYPYPGAPEGRLIQNLDALAVEPADIDTILITHSDNDHIGGILDAEGRLQYPNAHYYLSANSWRFWSSGEGRSKIAELTGWGEEWAGFVWGIYSEIQERLTIVDYEVEFILVFQLIPAEGHRYDHDVLKIESLGEKLFHIVDSLIEPFFMAEHDWYFIYDSAPDIANDTKERLLERCVAEKGLVFATHFPFPGLGRIEKGKNGWRWLPVKD